ncbi:MAG: AAA family ATPase [Planctomycetota bacterium]|nr:MAG: AAA family ATPase [Planctomycetota bacterium]
MSETVLENKEFAEEKFNEFREKFNKIQSEIARFIVGQEDVVNKVLIAVICGGHALIEGVPGLGKTALVNTLSKAIDVNFNRIQFTPDLLPADLIGTNILLEKNGQKVLEFQKGPVFTNILLADEINRATPKTQSALLQVMQEKIVTVGGKTYQLDMPFFVLATQNPIEMDGTYALPEAQLDRFFFKLNVGLPNMKEFSAILDRTTGVSEPEINSVVHGADIIEMGNIAKHIPIEESVRDYLVKIVRATHPDVENSPETVKKYIRYGASPRAAQAILAGARVNAILNGRYHVSSEDVDEIAVPALRHRILLSFEGEAEKIMPDEITQSILESVN